jgi:PKD domain
MSHRAGTIAAASALALLVLAAAAVAAAGDSPSTSLNATTTNGHGRVTAACSGTATTGTVDFGDGTTAVLRPPTLSATHAYGAGTFTAKLTCSDGSSSSSAMTTVSSTGRTTTQGGSSAAHASSSLTPGALDPDVTQATIASTICKAGWAAGAAPSAAFLAGLKSTQLRRYHATGKPASYVVDHLIPIELGGAPTDVRNLWPQSRTRARPDGVVTAALVRGVCAGTIPLARAQKLIATIKRAAG